MREMLQLIGWYSTGLVAAITVVALFRDDINRLIHRHDQ